MLYLWRPIRFLTRNVLEFSRLWRNISCRQYTNFVNTQLRAGL
jgi:hypothetical protein